MANTTDIRILNNNFEFESILDVYESFIWTDRFNECGDFELYTKLDPELLDKIQIGYFLEIPESDRLMVVESVVLEHDYEKGNVITIKGRSVESILDRRVIWDPVLLENVGLGSLIKTLIYKSFIDPTDASRKVNNFIFKEPIDSNIESIVIDSIQLFGENLYEVITNLCKAYKIGYKIVLTDNNEIEFSLYSGVDRTYDQDTYPAVVFSTDFDNIINSNFVKTDSTFKTACLVLGEGEGTDKTKVEVNRTGTFIGLDRREMAISESIATNGDTVTNTNYALQLYQKGAEALTESEVMTSFDGEIDPSKIYIYERDYGLGDLIQTVNGFGQESIMRVVEYIRSYGSDGISYYPTFDYDNNEVNSTYRVISYNVISARKAVEDAAAAHEAADRAEEAANDAVEYAESAFVAANAASDAATGAAQAAQSAVVDAGIARASANEAKTQAQNATVYANGALTQLSTVESVVDTLTWISEHSTFIPTTDTSVVSGKTYYVPSNNILDISDGVTEKNGLTFTVKDNIVTVNGTATADTTFSVGVPSGESGSTIYISGINGGSSSTYMFRYKSAGSAINIYDGVYKTTKVTGPGGTLRIVVLNGVTMNDIVFTPTISNANDGYEYSIVSDPEGNPVTNGYFELSTDEAVKTYVKSHLSLTNEGLWVLNDNSSYKILLSSNGMKVYDANGVLVASFGESISFSANRTQYIGNNNCYVAFNPANGGSLTIGGAVINIGNQTLDQVLNNKADSSDIPSNVSDLNNDSGFISDEAVVTVYPTAVDFSAGTATLAVLLTLNGVAKTPSSYKWTKGTSTTSIGTASTLNVTDLSTFYNCTVTWT